MKFLLRLTGFTFVIAFFVCLLPSFGQQATTRTEEINAARKHKVGHLWPERQSPLVDRVNKLTERGLLDGIKSGQGSNGWQFLIGGMRSGQGTALGTGYRRTDLWQDRIGFRTTLRGTFYKAVLFDLGLDFQSLKTDRTFLNVYAKYEQSPRMSFFGEGPNSSEEQRTSYSLDDTGVDVNAGYEIFQNFRSGLTGGVVDVHTGCGSISGVPCFDEVFDPEEAPGLGEDTTYLRWGAFVVYDNKDNPTLPRRGGLYGARFRFYSDRDLDQFNFRQTEFELQQYIPYFNETRVIAIRLQTVLSFASSGDAVPVYFQPSLGGNEYLRSFPRYRFHDNNSIYATVEHRWYAFTGLEMAVFVDAGKVVPQKSQINFSNLEFSAGIGFRFRINHGLISRIDLATGEEGFRIFWSFSGAFKLRNK